MNQVALIRSLCVSLLLVSSASAMNASIPTAIADSPQSCAFQSQFLTKLVESRLALAHDTSPESGDWTTTEPKKRTTQSPTAALFKSMVIPGWGQFGNREYLKAGLVVVVEGTLFARWLHFRSRTAEQREIFEATTDFGQRSIEFNEFERLRDRRNLFAWLTGTAIFISMIDAFVGAHLAGFPETTDESTQALHKKRPVSTWTAHPSLGFVGTKNTSQSALGLTVTIKF